jgi:hypothetical protein
MDNRVYQLKETTEGLRQNVYFIRNNKLVAFWPEGRPDDFIIYDVPKSFSKRYRTFETIAVTNGL